MRFQSTLLLLSLDLIGTAVFAAEGASTAVRFHLDIFGILVISFVTALGGGLIRDVLIGDTPPSTVRDWRYPATALIAGAIVYLLHLSTDAMNFWAVTTLDAAGLSLFAVAGAAKALNFNIHPLLATMMGVITGVGGGTIRDILINQVPGVLRSDIYAVAALVGAVVMITTLKSKLPQSVATILGIAACFILRMVAVYRHWNLPHA